MKLLKDKTLLKILIFSLLAVVIYSLLASYGVFFIPNAKLLDLYSRLATRFKSPPSSLEKIVILGIDSESIHRLNRRWPWRRSVTAQLLNKLKSYKPKVVFFDFILSGRSQEEDDLLLQKALKSLRDVFIASYINERGQYIRPHKLFIDSSLGYGLINKPRDKDLFVRRTRAVVLSKRGKILDYSLVLKTFCRLKDISYKEISYDKNKRMIFIPLKGKPLFIPLLKDNTLEINYSFSPRNFKVISAWQVFKKKLAPSLLKEKVVFIGTTSEISHDTYPTPLGVLPGIMINAYEMVTLLEKNFIRYISLREQFFILLFLIGIISIFSYRLNLSKGAILFFVVLGIYLLFSFWLHLKNIRLDNFAVIFLGIISFVGINFYKQIRLFMEASSLKQLAITDSLTGTYLRRYFQLRLQYECDRALRYGNPLSLLLLDIDYFKKINDTYGHLCGDFVLKEIASLLKSLCRKVDLISRYGGEEFSIILPQTEKRGALLCAERIREAVSSYRFSWKDKSFKVSVSIGVAEFKELTSKTPQELISLADKYLYEAKEKGRNQVVG